MKGIQKVGTCGRWCQKKECAESWELQSGVWWMTKKSWASCGDICKQEERAC